MIELTDNSPMPFGKFKNTLMANVPADYLMWIREAESFKNYKHYLQVLTYIEDNLDCLKQEIERSNA